VGAVDEGEDLPMDLEPGLNPSPGLLSTPVSYPPTPTKSPVKRRGPPGGFRMLRAYVKNNDGLNQILAELISNAVDRAMSDCNTTFIKVQADAATGVFSVA
jgi:hypothetical protein